MDEDLIQMMVDYGVVKEDLEYVIGGKQKSSRGYYIVIPGDGIYYLHHDGVVRSGVIPPSGRGAFWGTKAKAQAFLNNWKAKNTESLEAKDGD